MKRLTDILIAFCFPFLLLTQGFAQDFPNLPSESPRIVVGVVVDQYRYDMISRYWDDFSSGGFRKIISNGAYCRNAQYNYMYSQLAPAYATIASGTPPSVHGIVADHWYEPLKEQMLRAAIAGEYKNLSRTDSKSYAPENMFCETFSDRLKMYHAGESKVISISPDPDAAVLLGGFQADAAFWLDSDARWCSSSYYMDSLPEWVRNFNKKDYPATYFERSWNLYLPEEKYANCLPDTNTYEYGYDSDFKHFPYVYADMLTHYKGSSLIKRIPEGNTLTTDFAVNAMIIEGLGSDAITDVLMLNYGVNEYVGSYFGPESREVKDLMLRLDREIAHLISVCEERFGKSEVLFMLTASSGMSNNPEYLRSIKMPGGNFKHHYITTLLRNYLKMLYGEGDWVRDYDNQQIFLNRTLIEDAELDLDEMQKKAAGFILNSDGVSNALTSNQLQYNVYTSGIFEKMQHSYHPKRSGDLMINLKPGWIKDVSYASQHNSPYLYDTHVPLVWYGWKIRKSVIDAPVHMSDIAPSISYMLNIPYPSASTGNPIPGLMR